MGQLLCHVVTCRFETVLKVNPHLELGSLRQGLVSHMSGSEGGPQPNVHDQPGIPTKRLSGNLPEPTPVFHGQRKPSVKASQNDPPPHYATPGQQESPALESTAGG